MVRSRLYKKPILSKRLIILTKTLWQKHLVFACSKMLRWLVAWKMNSSLKNAALHSAKKQIARRESPTLLQKKPSTRLEYPGFFRKEPRLCTILPRLSKMIKKMGIQLSREQLDDIIREVEKRNELKKWIEIMNWITSILWEACSQLYRSWFFQANTKYSLESSWRDLQGLQTFAPLRSQNLSQNLSNSLW